MFIYDKVNNHLRPSGYLPEMVEKKRRPGSRKGEPKPSKRTLDPGFPARLNGAFAQRPGLTVPQLAAEVGCTRAVLHNYLKGKNKTIEALLLFEVADKLGVSTRWLLTGQGAMAMTEALTPDQTRVLQTFSRLVDENIRDHWIKQGEDLLSIQPSLLATPADPFNGKTVPPTSLHEKPSTYATTRSKETNK